MTKLIKAEVYKFFHSPYLWGILLGYILLVSSLIPDYLRRGETCLEGSLYIGTFFTFMIVALAVTYLGNEFEQRVIQHYVTSGNSRNGVFFSKTFLFLLFGSLMMVSAPLVHSICGTVFGGEALDLLTIAALIPSFIATCTVPMFFAFLFKDVGKTLGSGLIFFILIIASLNTDGISEWAVYLPYAQRLLCLRGTFFENYPLLTAINLIWTAVFTAGSYLAFRHSDLK